MINSRRLQQRIEILVLTPVPDGFGGETVAEITQGLRWANVTDTSKSIKQFTDTGVVGVNDFSNSYIFTFRFNTVITDPKQFKLIWKGERYDVFGIINPEGNDIEIRMLAKKTL